MNTNEEQASATPEQADPTTEGGADRQGKRPLEEVYFKVDVRQTADEVDGWNNIDRFQMSVGVVYNPRRQRMQVFEMDDAYQMVQVLRAADCAIGYNAERFDLVVLGGNAGTSVGQIRCVDMYRAIRERLCCGVSLENLVRANFEEELVATRAEQVRLWKAGLSHKVVEGGFNQVLALKRLHDRLKEHRYLRYFDRHTGKPENLLWE